MDNQKKKKIPFLLGEAAGSDLSRPGVCAKVISRCQSKNIYIYISVTSYSINRSPVQ